MASEEEFDINVELLEAARYGEAEEVREILAHGAYVDFQDDGGNTGLALIVPHISSSQGLR
jgi:hypothetical protein